MAKRRGRAVNGWVIIDKPAGISSAAAVARVKRLFDAAKAGHGGTLDPLATGVLPIALGEATKTMSYAMDGTKQYRFTLRWGEERTTDDAEGEVVAESSVRPETAAIAAILGEFTGDIAQVPPTYSAIKLGGKRAYALARAAEPVELRSRTVRIDRIDLVDRPDPERSVFEVACGSGTYMRSLARDIARRLGGVGYVEALRRLAVGKFTEDQAIPLAELEALGHSAAAFAQLRPLTTALDDIPALAVDLAQAGRLTSGQSVRMPGLAPGVTGGGAYGQGQVVCATAEGRLIALARIDGDSLRPIRVLNL